MIVTTTYNVEGRQISEYIRVVAGETVSATSLADAAKPMRKK